MTIAFEESHAGWGELLFFRMPATAIVTKNPKDKNARNKSATNRMAIERTVLGRTRAKKRSDESSLDLVRRALAGEDVALRALIDRLTPVVQARVSRALLRNSDRFRATDAREILKDLTQEVFASLFDKDGATLRRWDPQRGASLENFVGFVTERRVISALRRPADPATAEDDGPEAIDPSPEASPERRTASREQLRALTRHFREKLSPLGWTMFELLFVWGGSVREVSEETGMKTEAVRKWRTRLRQHARQWAASCEKKGRGHD